MRTNAIYWRLLPFLLSGLLLPGFMRGYHDSTVSCGTLAGHTMAAAAWLAVGPMALHWRLLVAVVWPVLLYLAVEEYIYQGYSVGNYDLAVFLMALWLVSLGVIRLALHLTGSRPQSEAPQETAPRRFAWQFRLLELLIITGVVAILLGIGRNVVPEFLQTNHMARLWNYWVPWLITTVPFGVLLLFTALDKTSRVITIAVSPLIAIAGVFILDFVFERYSPLWISIKPDRAPTIIVGLLWIMLFGVTLRTSGYQLERTRQRTT